MRCKKRQTLGLGPQEVQNCMRWHRRAYKWQRLHVLCVVGIIYFRLAPSVDLFAVAEPRRRQMLLGGFRILFDQVFFGALATLLMFVNLDEWSELRLSD